MKSTIQSPIGSPGYIYFLPRSPRGTCRDLIVLAENHSLNSILSSEAYAYQSCEVYMTPYSASLAVIPGTHGPKVLLGYPVSLEDVLDGSWEDSLPDRLSRPTPEVMVNLLTGQRKMAVITRYGRAVLLEDGDLVEPLDPTPKPLTVKSPDTGNKEIEVL